MVSELIWKKDGNGKYAYYKYDIAGRLVAKLAGLVNAEGEITCGKVTAYAYDAWGRLEKVNYDYLSGESNPRWPLDVPVSIVSGDVTYTYELPDGHTDVGSRLRASMSDSSGTSEYTYDLLGRQKTYKPPVGLDPGFFVEYDYNSAGQKTRIKITNGTTTSYDVTYDYFANGWLKEVKYNGDMVASYEYDAVGNRLTQTNGNGTSTEYAYDTSDSRHFLNSITHKHGSTILAAIDYTRDDSGNPLTMTDSIGTWNYGYDANNRLVGAVPPNPVPEQPAGGPYEYDWVGNRVRPPRDPNPPSTTNQMVYNKADQLVIWPGMHTYTYYGDGSLQYEKNAAGTSVLKSYTYTPDGLLSTATFNGKTLANAWDADENRVGFTVNSTNHTFVYDTTAGIPAVIQEDCVYYIREPSGKLLARIHESDGMRYYHFDALGSTRCLTNISGSVSDAYAYDAYGMLVSHTTSFSSVDQPYLYIGQFGYYSLTGELELNLLHLGLRCYDPLTARFITTDPAKEGNSAYVYVLGCPTTKRDPTGLATYACYIPMGDRNEPTGHAWVCTDGVCRGCYPKSIFKGKVYDDGWMMKDPVRGLPDNSVFPGARCYKVAGDASFENCVKKKLPNAGDSCNYVFPFKQCTTWVMGLLAGCNACGLTNGGTGWWLMPPDAIKLFFGPGGLNKCFSRSR